MQKSLLGKVWVYDEPKSSDFISHFLEKNNIIDEDEYFEKKYPEGLNNEDLLPDIKKAVKRIIKAIKNKEKIVVFGDYDCDGIPGTTISYQVLKDLGALVSYRIPDRENDGYGLKNYLIDEICDKGVSLIITVDNGISAINEADYIEQKGIDLIITDHHKVGDKLPKALAVINPFRLDSKYPFKFISGACVAWKLMIALGKEIKGDEYSNKFIRDRYIDLVALSTVADLMPLIGENRVIVSRGLEDIKNTENVGLGELIKRIDFQKDGKLTSDFFAYYLGPLINASGRMSSPYYALQLLLGKTDFASHLENLNNERKKIIEEVLNDIEKIEIDLNNIIFLENENWRSGIIGLIAGKVTERLCLPSVVVQKKGDLYFGSCRAPIGFDLYEFLNEFKEYFSHFGGHNQACGFALNKDNFDIFKKIVLEKGKEKLLKNPLVDSLNISYELKENNLNLDFVKELERLEPFGNGNENPIFLISNVDSVFNLVGVERKHLNIFIGGNRAIGFGFGRFENDLQKAKKIDIAVTLGTQIWNGIKKVNIQIVDIRVVE